MRPTLTLIVLAAIVLVGCAGEGDAPAAGDASIEIDGQTVLVSDLPGEPVDGEAQTTASGLVVFMGQEGSGAMAQAGQTVAVHYTGYLLDGTSFDSSLDRGEPFPFNLGQGAVIQGWDEGIALLSPGSTAKLVIPSALGYGAMGFAPLIPADAPLVFDVELVSVQ